MNRRAINEIIFSREIRRFIYEIISYIAFALIIVLNYIYSILRGTSKGNGN